ncbi:MAG: hypothetical protein ABSC53_06985 [Bacteroidota bacterium]
MNNNESYFRQKFSECGKLLSVDPSKLISLKYRDIGDYQYYKEMLDHLRNTKGLNVKDLGNILNGRAYQISASNQNILLVEHETGLEILYITGSVASLIGLVLQISSMVGNHRRPSNSFSAHFEDVEIRYFDDGGKFVEEHKHDYMPYEMFLPPVPDSTEIERLNKKIASLEKKVKVLSKNQTKKKKK